MPTVRTDLIELSQIQKGIHDCDAIPIPDDATELYVEIPRCTDTELSIWPDPKTTIKYDQEVSYDNGKTWIYWGGFEAKGGIHEKTNKEQASFSTLKLRLRDGKNRLLRSKLTTSKACKIALAVEARDTVLSPIARREHHSPTYDDGAGACAASATSVSTAAWTNAGDFILAGMGWGAWGAGDYYSAIKWGGAAGQELTKVGNTYSEGTESFVAMAYKVAPNTGSYQLYGALNDEVDLIFIGGATWDGVDPDTPLGTVNGASGGGGSPSVNIASAADEVVQDCVFDAYGDSTPEQDASQTLIGAASAGDGGGGCSYEYYVDTTPIVMSWSTNNDIPVVMGVSIKPSAGGGPEPQSVSGSMGRTAGALSKKLMAKRTIEGAI